MDTQTMPDITYRKDFQLELDQFIGLYEASTLSERRPANDRAVMRQMMENADLTVTAWDEDHLVGISRCLTDFGYVAYLSDLAVAESHQKKGIGKRLIEETKAALDPNCMIVLLSAPAANAFYPGIGFTHNPRAWILPGNEALK
jgi:GNAT superfamily N-acetyltransferase